MNDDRVDRTEVSADVRKQLKSTMKSVTVSRQRTEMRIVQGARAETWADSEE
jgi:hypothetical protein